MGAGMYEVRSSVFSAIFADNDKTFLRHFKKGVVVYKRNIFKKKMRVICLDRKIDLYNCTYVLYTNKPLHLLNFNRTSHYKKSTFFLTPRIDLVTQNIMSPKYLKHIYLYTMFFRTVNTRSTWIKCTYCIYIIHITHIVRYLLNFDNFFFFVDSPERIHPRSAEMMVKQACDRQTYSRLYYYI